ncbi:MAG: hypothetical protein NC412_13220 [Roseburia sp.]|nr:hypothetical protein [Roseburia sp.]MCM1279933.1 hypothetical protein [Robinsoniella sp.]
MIGSKGCREAIHADFHELVQCRFLCHEILPSVVSYLNSETESWQIEK